MASTINKKKKEKENGINHYFFIILQRLYAPRNIHIYLYAYICTALTIKVLKRGKEKKKDDKNSESNQ